MGDPSPSTYVSWHNGLSKDTIFPDVTVYYAIAVTVQKKSAEDVRRPSVSRLFGCLSLLWNYKTLEMSEFLFPNPDKAEFMKSRLIQLGSELD